MRQRIRVLLFTWPFAPSIGGLELLSELTAKAASQAGIEVTVVTSTVGPRLDLPFRVERRPSLRRLWRLVREASVVHLNTFEFRIFVLSWLLRRPIAWQHIDFDTISPRGICAGFGRPCEGIAYECYACLRRDFSRGGALRMLARRIILRAAASFVDCNLVSTEYGASRLRLPRQHLLEFGVETLSYAPPQDRLPPPPLRVLFYARHVPAKGCDVLLRALAHTGRQNTPIVARVGGDGPHRLASIELAKSLDLGDSVTFLGRLTETQKRAELHTAHVVVIPTTQDEIGQYVAWEAMLSGCAVVASDVGAFPEHIADAGILFPKGDAAALAATLARLANSPALLIELGRRGRMRVLGRYDAKIMGERYVSLYRGLAR